MGGQWVVYKIRSARKPLDMYDQARGHLGRHGHKLLVLLFPSTCNEHLALSSLQKNKRPDLSHTALQYGPAPKTCMPSEPFLSSLVIT